MSPSPPTPEPADCPPACAAFDRLVNRVLDGDVSPTALNADPHPVICRACRQTRAATFLLIDGLNRLTESVPSAGFVDGVTRTAVRDYRRRTAVRWTVRTGVGALAAAVLIGWLVLPTSDSSPTANKDSQKDVPVPILPDAKTYARQDPPAETIRGRISEAGSAVVSLTRKATDDTLTPARNLFATPAPRVNPKQPAIELPDPLAEMPQAARAGLEPLADTAKRAVNLFLRDVGGVTGSGKMKS
jgi:hypothetical protein